MEAAGVRGTSRKRERRERSEKSRRFPHSQTVRFGGFDKDQITCYPWDLVKSAEALWDVGNEQEFQEIIKLGTRLRRQIRAKIRRYFVRQKCRNVKMAVVVLTPTLYVAGVFGILIGADRAAGNSMYSCSNHGDWIVYGRNSRKMQRNDAIVFEKNGGCTVKRIVGLPGDTVEISLSGSWVVINRTQVREDCVTLADVPGDVEGKTDVEQLGAPQTVMDRQYPVLGDNRGVSVDSRDSSIGAVPVLAAMGRAILVVRTAGQQRG